MSALRKISPFLRPYRVVLILGLLTTVLPVVMELLIPRLLQYMIDQGIRAGNMQAIWTGGGLMFLTALLGAVATLGQGYCRAQISQGVAYDLRNALFAHIQSLSFANLDQMQTGQLMTRLSSDVDMVRNFASAGLALLLRALLMILGALVMVLIVDWQLGLVVVAMLLVAAVVIRLILRTVQPLFMVVQAKLAALNTIVQENLAGVQVVKAFVRESHAIGQFEEGNAAYLRQNVRVGRLLALAIPLLALITNVGMVAVIWFGGVDVISGRLSVGELVAFNNYLLIGMAPLLLLSNMLAMVSRADASAERILELLATEPAIRVAPQPYRSPTVAGEVVFEDVSFHYGDHQAGNGRAQGHLPALPAPLSSQNGVAPSRGVNGGDANGAAGEVLSHVSFAVAPGQTV
ncbi:MAG TPA: ABC transporter ATP-binding protein, partial [Caldilineaceae bacterium]|nr:ABC transporter ATP-binding protein [Caldilineaceae bacterium]